MDITDERKKLLLGPYSDPWQALNEMYRAMCAVLDKPEGEWPDHRNFPLAASALVALRKRQDDTNYADAPASIGELRADKDGNASKWTTRDALISMLRDIDSGKYSPDAGIVVIRENKGEGVTSTWYAVSSPDYHVTMGLLEAGKQKLNLMAHD